MGCFVFFPKKKLSNRENEFFPFPLSLSLSLSFSPLSPPLPHLSLAYRLVVVFKHDRRAEQVHPRVRAEPLEVARVRRVSAHCDVSSEVFFVVLFGWGLLFLSRYPLHPPPPSKNVNSLTKQDGLAAPVLDLVDGPGDEAMRKRRGEEGCVRGEKRKRGDGEREKRKKSRTKKIKGKKVKKKRKTEATHRCAMLAENSGFNRTWYPAQEFDSSKPLACLS